MLLQIILKQRIDGIQAGSVHVRREPIMPRRGNPGKCIFCTSLAVR
jgi:hypothetical protein